MANEQYAFIDRGMVPSRSQWQQAITDARYELQIDDSLVPFSHSGFLPCRLLNVESGVETYYGSTTDAFADPAGIDEIAGGKDFCISFRWGGDLREAACAMILSYVLARSFGAIVSYQGDSPYTNLAALRNDTDEILKLAQEDRKNKRRS